MGETKGKGNRIGETIYRRPMVIFPKEGEQREESWILEDSKVKNEQIGPPARFLPRSKLSSGASKKTQRPWWQEWSFIPRGMDQS